MVRQGHATHPPGQNAVHVRLGVYVRLPVRARVQLCVHPRFVRTSIEGSQTQNTAVPSTEDSGLEALEPRGSGGTSTKNIYTL